jgi:HEAT repeat protein
LRTSRAVDPLLLLLKDKKKLVRKMAAYALGVIGNDRAIAALMETLSDDAGEVRDSAQQALDSIKNEKARKNTDSASKV